MDKFILQVSLIRIVNQDVIDNLTNEEKKAAYDKFELQQRDYCNAIYKNGYYILDNYQLLWYLLKTNEYYINIALNQADVVKISNSIYNSLKNQKLNPIIEALLYKEYMQLQNLSPIDLALCLNKTQGAISNKMRLLNLPIQIQQSIIQNKLKERHGRAILKLKKEPDFYKKAMIVYLKILEDKLTVSQCEDLVDQLLGNPVGVKDSLNIKKVIDDKDYKIPEAKMIVDEIEKELLKTLKTIKQIFPKLDISLNSGVDRKDYVFLLKLKGLNDNHGKNNRNN